MENGGNCGEVHFIVTEEKKQRGKLAVFILDKVEFIGLSALVFAISFIALNFGSIYVNLEYQWQNWRGLESPLQEIINGSVDEGDLKAQLLSFDKIEKNKTAIPRLNMDVYPPDMRIIIPRINKNVPVVGVDNENLIARDWSALEEDIQNALKNGVIHYPGTALPGEGGNTVLTGHSSYYAWNAGRFKDVFALLHEVEMGDRIVVFFNQKKYIYEVFDIKVVFPSQIDVLGRTNDERLTLITCTPIGTNIKRLVVSAKLAAEE